MADVETPVDGSEAVGTRERDGREPKPKAVPHPTGGAGGAGQGGAGGGAAFRAGRLGAGL